MKQYRYMLIIACIFCCLTLLIRIVGPLCPVISFMKSKNSVYLLVCLIPVFYFCIKLNNCTSERRVFLFIYV